MKEFRSLFTIELKEGESPKEIQLLRVGQWKHPEYGNFEITSEDLVMFKENFDNNVRKVQLALDAEHFPEKGAAAWFKEVVVKGKDLFALVDWTAWGKEVLKSKQFKYISAEFNSLYSDNENGKTFKNVLLGAGLTNRPFIKGMQPVLLSEHSEFKLFEPIKTEGGSKMELKELITALKLKEDAKSEDVVAMFNDLSKVSKDGMENITKLNETIEGLKVELTEAKKTDDGMVKLSEKEVKELKDGASQGTEAIKKLNEMSAANTVELGMRAGKILPAQKEWATGYALSDPQGFGKWMETAPVVCKFTEEGSQANDDNSLENDKGNVKLNEKAMKLSADEKISFKDAIDQLTKKV